MKLLSVASEIFPLIKTGGLADVVGALPLALAKEDVATRTLIPGYPSVMARIGKGKKLHHYDSLFGEAATLISAKVGDLDLIVLDCPPFFGRAGGPYDDMAGNGWPVYWRRFAALSRAGADIAAGLLKGWLPDVVHAHDWQAAMTLAYMRFGAAHAVPKVVTIHNPVRQSEVRAAVKMFHDPDIGRDYAFVFVKGEPVERDAFGRVTVWANARRYVAYRNRVTLSGKMRFSPRTWEWDTDLGGAEGEELNHRHVPVVRFRNRHGLAEFERHTDTLDRINHGILQRIVITLYQAYRLRTISVDDDDAPDVDPETGEEIDYENLLVADPGAFLKLPLGAKLWESAQADLTGVLSAVKDDILYYMEQTKTPLPAVSDAVQQSAEGAANIKEGNQFKTERTQTRVKSSLSLVYMIAFLCLEDEDRAEPGTIRIDCHPTTRPSLGEKYDAFSKSKDLPLETRMAEVLQFDPERIAMANAQLLRDRMMGVLDDPGNTPAPGITQDA